MKKLVPLLFLLTVLMSCNEDDINRHDCVFGQNDESLDAAEENAIMKECYESRLTSKSDIENNLIGKWELIGHGESWGNSNPKPCSYITIINNKLLLFQFKNERMDTATIHSWEVRERGVSGHSFYLFITPAPPYSIYPKIFCNSYMYEDDRPVDGYMHLYKKVE